MLTLAKIAVINFLAFLLVIWIINSGTNEKDVTQSTRVFIGAWWAITLFLWFVTVAWFIWTL